MKGEYCLSTSGVGSPPHSLPSTSGTQNDKLEDVHCACISKLETQVEEQVSISYIVADSYRNITLSLILLLRKSIRRALSPVLDPFIRSFAETTKTARCETSRGESRENKGMGDQ